MSSFYDYECGVVRDTDSGQIDIVRTLERYGFVYVPHKMLYARPDNWAEPTARHEFKVTRRVS